MANKPAGMQTKSCIHPRNFHNSTIIFLYILIFVLPLAITGCVSFNDPEVSQEFNASIVATAGPTSTVGQSFISRRARLDGLTIWISSPIGSENNTTRPTSIPLKAELFHHSDDVTPIFATTLLVAPTSSPSPLTIRFPELGDTDNTSYYLLLSSTLDFVQIHGRDEDTYVTGQAYVNGQPINADIAFRSTYNYDSASLLADLLQGLKQIWLIFPLLAILFIPGWLLFEFSGLGNKFDVGERWAISIGLSISIFPVAMVWTTQFNIQWSKAGILTLSIILGAVFTFHLIRKYITQINQQSTPDKVNSNFNNFFTSSVNTLSRYQLVALIAVFLGTLIIRLVMVRDLATPAWVDSVHHALFTRLILTDGNYPASYLPYLDIPVATYHLGFHSLAAAFTWLSGLRLEQALLILGQVLNALIVFSVYLMAKTLTRSANAGLFSAVITGFITPMPAYYTSWGRYTELTGLILLPIAFVFLHSFKFTLTIREKRWIIVLGALSSAGLFMVHYRVVIFLSILILVYLLISFLDKKDDSQPIKTLLKYIVMITLIGVTFVIPWIYKTIQIIILPLFSNSVSSPTPLFQDFSWAYLSSALGKYSLVLCILGLIWGIARMHRFSFLLSIWVISLFVIANLGAIKLPGGALISNSSVEIMLFIPISIIGGFLLDQITQAWKILIPEKLHTIMMITIVIAVGIVSLVGARQLLTIINPITVLTRSADLPALEWVQTNIPANETIVINPSPWGYGIYAGNDGGYWVSPLAGKSTLPSPVLYGLGSSSNQINEMSQKIIQLGNDPGSLREYMLQKDLKYVFVGARGGAISPTHLNESGLFILLYHQSGVWIFLVKP